jgi:hypothetical protein
MSGVNEYNLKGYECPHAIITIDSDREHEFFYYENSKDYGKPARFMCKECSEYICLTQEGLYEKYE